MNRTNRRVRVRRVQSVLCLLLLVPLQVQELLLDLRVQVLLSQRILNRCGGGEFISYCSNSRIVLSILTLLDVIRCDLESIIIPIGRRCRIYDWPCIRLPSRRIIVTVSDNGLAL